MHKAWHGHKHNLRKHFREVGGACDDLTKAKTSKYIILSNFVNFFSYYKCIITNILKLCYKINSPPRWPNLFPTLELPFMWEEPHHMKQFSKLFSKLPCNHCFPL
ncbi:unnamed protein product [Cuscuta epithymum]|uniref:Uncharacterized protein n=1 Tax=Cuscuta epithymum TaxID=186058 RepID=A0AAV0ELN3_9ASTE|nr:unnamed protein product [Cuscuta epithymum]